MGRRVCHEIRHSPVLSRCAEKNIYQPAFGFNDCIDTCCRDQLILIDTGIKTKTEVDLSTSVDPGKGNTIPLLSDSNFCGHRVRLIGLRFLVYRGSSGLATHQPAFHPHHQLHHSGITTLFLLQPAITHGAPTRS